MLPVLPILALALIQDPEPSDPVARAWDILARAHAADAPVCAVSRFSRKRTVTPASASRQAEYLRALLPVGVEYPADEQTGIASLRAGPGTSNEYLTWRFADDTTATEVVFSVGGAYLRHTCWDSGKEALATFTTSDGGQRVQVHRLDESKPLGHEPGIPVHAVGSVLDAIDLLRATGTGVTVESGGSYVELTWDRDPDSAFPAVPGTTVHPAFLAIGGSQSFRIAVQEWDDGAASMEADYLQTDREGAPLRSGRIYMALISDGEVVFDSCETDYFLGTGMPYSDGRRSSVPFVPFEGMESGIKASIPSYEGAQVLDWRIPGSRAEYSYDGDLKPLSTLAEELHAPEGEDF